MAHYHQINYLLTFLLLLRFLHAGETGDDKITVRIAQGLISGSRLTSRDGSNYAAFYGIPYGEIVTRFEPAVPSPGWGDEVRDASVEGASSGILCPQFDRSTQTVVGVEQCLILNIFVKEDALSEAKKPIGLLPVVVFVHGGAFQFGTANDYGGEYFVDQDVILVVPNYRLAALGFLSTGDSVIQGNAGLKDQTESLRWIQENILSFHGDPRRVTLFGTSAGATSVAFQLLSPAAAGLFHAAQMTSGSVLTPWSYSRNPAKAARELGESLDCPTTSGSEALAECLRSTDFRKIVQIRLAKWYVDPLCQFNPVVEALRPGQRSTSIFLSEDPLRLLEEGRFSRVPVITGLCKDEGLLFHAAGILKNPELQRNLNEDWNRVAPITLLYGNEGDVDLDSPAIREISRTVRGYYFGGRRIGGEETLGNLTHLFSDRYFNHGIKKAALLMARYTPVYPFILGFQGDWSLIQLYYGDAFQAPIGVSHGDDMRFLFNSPRFPKLLPGSEGDAFSKQLVKLYASFARTGNLMNSMTLGSGWTTPWLPIGPEEVRRTSRLKWFNLDVIPRMVREPFTDRVEFWDKVESLLALAREEKGRTGTKQEL